VIRGAYAVITGASQGLGEAFAEVCAARGWDLVLCALPGTGLDGVAQRIEGEYGVHVRALAVDLCTPEGRQELVSLAAGTEGRIDLLVNNAGFSRHGYFDLMPPEVPRRIVETNILATLEITRGLVPILARAAPSMIITVASLSGFRPMPLVSVYAASKSFLLHFGLALRLELRPLGISSTVLCPGGISTSPEVRARIAAQGPAARRAAMQPRPVAEAALRGALKGKAVVIPGAINKALRAVMGIVPRGLYMRGVHRRWKRALARSTTSVDYAFFDER
jgi:short-subunit dehydrogenase